ncbi:hypothetical protein [Paenibacillus whitsoniae]|uniref:DUF3396 domain-containing protein n=1 Tax=Paenibacillus whitsoniae TaxID=2496558 RepID=A0A430JJ97_9BACL|nr:hypothetical protein [Paenibacillus whitsoniae]RTE11187.1 hypothetical protein EJQ19_02545 [Paenibacillus whitsoniae]
MSNRILFEIYFDGQFKSTNEIADLLFGIKYFAPTKMKGSGMTSGSYQKFNEKKFSEGLRSEFEKGTNFIYGFKDEASNWFNLRRTDENMLISFALLDPLFNNEVLSDIEYIFIKYGGIVARGCSLEDDFWQNNTDLQFYSLKNKPLANVKLIPSPSFKDEKIVDVETKPGHSHIVSDTWFGSNWMMWFGREYFKFIPKEVLSGFKDCYENVEFPEDVIRIKLYENIWDYEIPENRERQWAFRKWTGIDEVAHMLTNQPKLSEDPAISITTEESCNYGGVRRITYFFNSDGEVVVKSKASTSKTYELDKTGTVVWAIEEKV